MRARIEPGPGQESVWDYPRPAVAEPTSRHLVVRFAGRLIAETRRGVRVLETSHPPGYYIPPEDVDASLLEAATGGSWCEWKGRARYHDVVVGTSRAPLAAWSYPEPTPSFELLRDHLSFYPGRVDSCTVDGELVTPQEGDFYGGWITSDVVGPFKGGEGTRGW